MQKEERPLILVDGSSYLYRAFHALPPLSNSRGESTGAVKGVVNMLRRLFKDYPESVVAVVFDAKGKTFRDDIYPEYKANRPPMPDEMREQIKPLHRFVRAMGFPMLVVEGVEADDVIGTLARQATESGKKVVVSTGDKDMAQLVTEHVSLVDTMQQRSMDEKGVEEKFGIPPKYIIDYLALRGDKSDNIPGVAGVGEKTALALLQNLGGLDAIYARLDEVADLGFRGAKTMAKKLEANRDNAELSYKLATIKCDVELEFDVHQLSMSPPDRESLSELMKQLEFNSWLQDLDAFVEAGNTAVGGNDGASPAEKIKTSNIDTEYETILTQETFLQWLKRLQASKLFAFDTETTSLDYMNAKIVGMSFSDEPGKAAYVPLGHDYLDAPTQIDLQWALNAIKPLLENADVKKVGQNLKYDMNVLGNYDIQLKGIEFDTMLESYVLNSTANRHDMDTLASVHLGHSTVHFEDIAGKGAKQLTFNQIEIDQASHYAAEDADVSLRLHQCLWPQLEKQTSLAAVLNSIEIPLVPVLSRIERNGALIDVNALAQQSLDHAAQMQIIERQAFDLAGEEFNLGSPKQLGNILFEKLEIPVVKKTKKGAASTSEEVLQELALDYELPKILLEYRSLSKLKSTYTDKLPLMVNKNSGRVHTSYHQAVAATGRLSSTEPNLQNIPIKTEAGRRIRQAFIAPEGRKILAADYSQIELRIMAHLSQDKNLIAAFENGWDVHSATAAEVFDVELEAVSTEQRRSAKAINFGLIYGMSAFGLARQLRIGRHDAQGYINLYFERYPGVARYMDEIKHLAKEQGFVETIKGRRLYLPEINSSNGMRRQGAERTAINAPMQGSAADIIKLAMIDIDRFLEEESFDADMIMQVHDELVFEVAESEVEDFSKNICERMQSAVELSVPLLVEAGSGANWDEAH